MACQAVPIGPRASKEEFLRALGFHDPVHPRVEEAYRQMRDEAVGVYQQLQADRSNLIEEKRFAAECNPPYYWHHVRPERRQAAVRAVWQRAQPGSMARTLFDKGATDGEYQPNWVTLWLLYSVFRSRDERNNRSNRNSRGKRSGDGKGRGVGNTSSPQATGRMEGRNYDPVRDVRYSNA